MVGIGRFSVVALDCPDPKALAKFYSAVTGLPISHDGGNWVELRSDGGVTIAFQQVQEYRPPQWPGSEHPQQLHLDFDVTDLDTAEAKVISLGATKADFQPGRYFRVFLDPAGHPFCLVLNE